MMGWRFWRRHTTRIEEARSHAIEADRPMRPTERFSDRVRDYVRYRRRYPAALVDVVAGATGLTSAGAVTKPLAGPVNPA